MPEQVSTEVGALLYLKNAARWSAAQRSRIAEWLITEAESLQERGRQYSAEYQQRYIVMKPKKKPAKRKAKGNGKKKKAY